VVSANPFAGRLFAAIADPSYNVSPPGLLGEIADFLCDSSSRQVEKIAVSIGLMADVCGRGYNNRYPPSPGRDGYLLNMGPFAALESLLRMEGYCAARLTSVDYRALLGCGGFCFYQAANGFHELPVRLVRDDYYV
jgi:hypothetical protein